MARLFTFLSLCFLLVLMATGAYAGKIAGSIIDSESSSPIPGATVQIKGTAVGVATSFDGKFVLVNAPAGTQILVVRSLGYRSQEIEVMIPEQELLTRDILLEPSTEQMGELVITGVRKSQIDAINLKKQSLNNVEVLTTNDIGRLPDVNVAEAAQRVSGVSIETDRGEGRFISIRGIQPSLNNVTINNTNIGSTSGSRETPLDLLPVEMISSIEVTKAVTPDMEANAIGGAINVNTISAFDRAKSFMVASVDGLVQTQQADYGADDKFPFRAAITAGKRFGEKEKFGAVVSANVFRRDFAVSVLDPDRWQLLKGTGPEGMPTPGYLGPNEIELQIEDNERDRYGMTMDLEYRPTTFSSIYFRSLFTRNIERYSNSEFELTVAGLKDQELTNQTPTSGRFSKGSGELDLSSGEQKENLYSFTLGGKNRIGDKLSLHLYGTMSKAYQTQFNLDGTFENPQDTEGLLANTYNTGPFFFDISAEDAVEARNPNLYILRNMGIRNNNTVEEDLYEASLDLDYDLKIAGMPLQLKAGGRYRSRQKSVDRAVDEYDDDSEEGEKASNPYTLAEFDIPAFAPVQGGAAPNVHGDADAFRAFFMNPANRNNGRIFYRADDTADELYSEDINYREAVAAGYAMGVLDMKYLSLIGGVRVEHTKTVSSPFVDEGGGFVQQDFENSYLNILPSLHLKLTPFENFVGRLSWTNTIGRPDYGQLSGASEFEYVETTTPNVFTGSFEGANPDLKPYEAMNLDLSLEYYFKTGGIVSVGGFYKNIENQIYNLDSTSNNITYEGKFFEELNFSRSINLNEAKVYGLEASFDQALTFLPSPFDGLGITANATLMDSEVTFPGREDDELPLFRQPTSVYNIIPYYQKYGIELRMAVTFRSAFLVNAALSTEGYVEEAVEAGYEVTDFDVYEAARTSIDLTAAYTFPSRKVKILGQVRNLTNAAEQEYRGVTSRYDRHELFGRSYFLGLSLNL
ncbi:TonB-dependent receptor [Cesiribacter sp. SM1]|uniref:TonB-dependent receptor n=1 Tax=Cesiribacter sp. SM1 TaxID=2861196 RepID=UPI001CD51F0C|nr:TonB-dependent receptor [Cesiribacter sp. SM1]